MATQIYLGNPPPKIKEWIEKNVTTGPNFKAETQVVFENGATWEGLIEGELTIDSFFDADDSFGDIYDYESNGFKEIIVGTAVTSIGMKGFEECRIYAIYIPNTVMSIEYGAFSMCWKLNNIYIANVETSIVNENAFAYINRAVSMPNLTTEQVEQLFENNVFGPGNDGAAMNIGEHTITCKDGIVNAIGIRTNFDEEDFWGEGWDITITPL